MKYTSILVLLGIVAIAIACSVQAEEEATDIVVRQANTTEVKSIDYQASVFATGILASAEEARLSFKTGGIIERIEVRAGQKVRKGQVLAKLALNEIQAQTQQATLGEDQAQITLNNARLALQLAERDYRNVNGLYQDSVATLEQLENVEVQLNNARNQLAAAEKGLAFRQQGVEVAQFNLRYSTIVAPSDGIILRQFAEVNELVGPGTPVLMFGSRQQAQVLQVAVADKDIVKLSLGDTAIVNFDAYPGEDFLAYVRELGGSADPFTGTYQVEVEIAPSQSNLLNGFVGSVTIKTQEHQKLLTIPIDALLKANGQTGQVMVVDKGTARLREVSIYSLQQDRLLIAGGLIAGEQVITAGAGYLVDGDAVTAMKNEE